MPQPLMDRRAMLKTLGMGAVGLTLSGCAGRASGVTTAPPYTGARLARVLVSPDRVIRTVVGLRPFRPSGFVVRTETFDEKIVIHNYGHGGGGMTLSWGAAHLAAEEAGATGKRACAVLGCGAVGLATARLLQRRGWKVTIYAKDLPPQTTSNISGAQWSPSSVFDPGETTAVFDEQFRLAMRFSYRYFQDLVGDYYGVRWVENYIPREEPRGPGGFIRQFPDMFPYTELLPPGAHPFHTPYALRYMTMFIEPPVYLNAVMRDFRLAGGTIAIRTFQDVPDILTLSEPVILNCTGLGARDLFLDGQLTPIKGQLTVLLPQPEVDYLMIYQGLYMFPRRDGILLGGTHERDIWSLDPNREAEEQILQGHMQFFETMRTGT